MDRARLLEVARDTYNKVLDVTESNMNEEKMEEIIIELLKGAILKGYVEGWEDSSDKRDEEEEAAKEDYKKQVPDIPPLTPYPWPFDPPKTYPWDPPQPPIMVMYGVQSVPYNNPMGTPVYGVNMTPFSVCNNLVEGEDSWSATLNGGESTELTDSEELARFEEFSKALQEAAGKFKKANPAKIEPKKGILMRNYSPTPPLPSLPMGTMVEVVSLHDNGTYMVKYSAASVIPGGDFETKYTAFVPKEYITIVGFKAQL